MRDEVIEYRPGALLGEVLIVIVRSLVVGMAGDKNPSFGEDTDFPYVM